MWQVTLNVLSCSHSSAKGCFTSQKSLFFSLSPSSYLYSSHTLSASRSLLHPPSLLRRRRRCVLFFFPSPPARYFCVTLHIITTHEETVKESGGCSGTRSPAVSQMNTCTDARATAQTQTERLRNKTSATAIPASLTKRILIRQEIRLHQKTGNTDARFMGLILA